VTSSLYCRSFSPKRKIISFVAGSPALRHVLFLLRHGLLKFFSSVVDPYLASVRIRIKLLINLNADPDPESQTKADPDPDTGQTHKVEFLHEKHKVGS
jgi:hypothetical protein